MSFLKTFCQWIQMYTSCGSFAAVKASHFSRWRRGKVISTLAGVVVWVASSPLLFSQNANDAFDPGANNPVYTLAVQADGKVLVGGQFTTLGSRTLSGGAVEQITRNRIGRLDVYGTLDTTFDPVEGASAIVRAVAVQNDGKILVGGDFTSLRGQPRNRIGRLNADGSLDDTFNPGASSSVSALVVQPDGKILVGGYFTTLDGQPRDRIGRLNANGSVDTTFVNPLANGGVPALALQVDGKILVGGNFTSLGGQPRNRIGRLNADGTLDPSFDPGVGADAIVNALAVQADAKIVVGGSFTSLRGSGRKRIGRLNADGTLDAGFNPGAEGAGTPVVNALAVQADAKIVVGGYFTTLGGGGRNQIGRLNADGTLDGDFNPGEGGSGATVLALALQSDARMVGGPFIVVGGSFTTLGSQPRNRIGRVNANGICEGHFNPGANGDLFANDASVFAVALQPDGKILLGGMFKKLGNWTCAGGATVPRNQIGRLNSDGTVDAFNPGATGEIPGNPAVVALAVQADGKILVGGRYTGLGGAARQNIGRLHNDGTVDGGFNPGANGEVSVLVPQPDGKILVGGGFTVLGGWARRGIGRLNSDGSVDAGFNPGDDDSSSVVAIALQEDGKILVGGGFESMAGAPRQGIARLHANGTLDDSFNPGANSVNMLAVQADGRILVGGYFLTELAGHPCKYLGRLHPNGSFDDGFNAGLNQWLYTLALDTDGKILLGGYFTKLGDVLWDHIGRLHPSSALDTTFNPGANFMVLGLAVQTDGKILAGGTFSTLACTRNPTLGGQRRDHIGRLTSGSPAWQTLTIDPGGGGLKWLRSGTGPELEYVTFEDSLDGINYTPLGNGVRISGGWKWEGVGLPINQIHYVRARGATISGFYGGSRGLIEAVRQFHGLPPVAGTDFLGTQTDAVVTVDASRLLSNDTDPDGDLLSIVAVSNGAHGTAVLSGDQVTYTPAPGYFGDDTFTYQLSDGFQLTTGIVEVFVRGGVSANIIGLIFEGDDVVVRFGGITLHTYEVQYSTFATGPWGSLNPKVTIPAGQNTAEYRHVGGALGPSGFYRTKDVTP